MLIPRTHVYKTNNKTKLAVVEGAYNPSSRKVEDRRTDRSLGADFGEVQDSKRLPPKNQDEGGLHLKPTT